MAKYELNGRWYTIKELSDLSGIKEHTIRDRLRRGYPLEESLKVTTIHTSVKEFAEHSLYQDWIGMSISDLFKIYWRWSIQNGYSPLQKQGFSRQLMSMYPMLKVVPIKRGEMSHRVIRLKERL